jgi:uncharacterized membrane protein YkoI
MFRRFILPLVAVLALGAPASAQGFPRDNWNGQEQRDEGREREREVPLSSIIRELRMRYGGQYVDAQRDGNRYRISWITEDGRRMTIEVDAQTGRVLSTR